MDVRIETAAEGARTIVVVAGRLSGAGIRELRRVCASSARLVLDLSDLVSTDAAGTEVLRSLVREGAEMRGASQFLQLLLENDQSSDEPPNYPRAENPGGWSKP